MAMLLWFSSTASHLDQNHQTLTLPTPEMHVSPHNLSPSPYSGRRPQDLHLPAKRKLGQLVSIQESESLRKNGIMIPSPWRGGYQSFLNLLSPLPPNYRTKVNHLLADEQLQLAFLAPTRTSVMEPSSTSSRLLTVTTSSSFDSLEEDHSTSCDLTCAKTLNCFCLKALMESLSFSPYLSCYGIGECLLYLCFKLCDLCISPLVLGLI
ncbi:unnamed protein product [Arabidopsis halleri]